MLSNCKFINYINILKSINLKYQYNIKSYSNTITNANNNINTNSNLNECKIATVSTSKKPTTPTGLRGMPDYYGSDVFKLRYIESIFIDICKKQNFNEIRTPILEPISCFIHTLGDTSDIVNKEMYVFNDKNNRTICLRPEGTAGVMRAVLNNDLLKLTNISRFQKLYYIGPMYRYESPQKGRLRQFNQFGIEYIGERVELSDVQADADVIHLAVLCLKKLNIYNNCTVFIFLIILFYIISFV